MYGGLSCLTNVQGGIIYVFLVTANMFTDLLILPIPSLLVYRIRNASLQSRLTVVFSFALSLGWVSLPSYAVAFTQAPANISLQCNRHGRSQA